MTTADEKMRDHFESLYGRDTWGDLSGEREAFLSGINYSAAQYSERIKELEHQNDQLQAQINKIIELVDDAETLWGDKFTEKYGEVTASEALRQIISTQTAEAYKRMVQSEALEKAATYLGQFSGMQYVNPEERLRRMAAELKEGE